MKWSQIFSQSHDSNYVLRYTWKHGSILTGSGNIYLVHFGPLHCTQMAPQSPDLNPLQDLWDVVEWKIHITDMQPTNLN